MTLKRFHRCVRKRGKKAISAQFFEFLFIHFSVENFLFTNAWCQSLVSFFEEKKSFLIGMPDNLSKTDKIVKIWDT